MNMAPKLTSRRSLLTGTALGGLGLAGAINAQEAAADSGESTMERIDVGPREIQGMFAYNHAIHIKNPTEWLILAGDESRDENGQISPVGDIVGQIEGTFAALKKTVESAGFQMSDIVQLRLVTTDIKQMTANYKTVMAVCEREGIRAATLMEECVHLSDPNSMLEIEGIAVR